MEEEKTATIEKDYSATPAADFAWLRRKGIDLIQQYAGKSWTDFNLHDPGVTILEALCYALTDLSYRTGFPVKDLLTDAQGCIDPAANAFFNKKEILSTGPVTIADYRKLVIDAVPEVENIWLEPMASGFSSSTLKGHFQVIIQVRSLLQTRWAAAEAAAQKEAIIAAVREVLVESRNLGEDFEAFVVLDTQPVMIEAEIVVDRNTTPEEILAQVYYRIEKAITPPVLFHTEAELVAAGYAVEDIYVGPLLQNGIILDAELRERSTKLDPSTLIRTISDMDEVLHIRHFELVADGLHYGNQLLPLQPFHYPVLVFNPLQPGIRLLYNNKPLPLKGSLFNALLLRLRDGLKRDRNSSRAVEPVDTSGGRFRNPGQYLSIQHLFPRLYGLGNYSPGPEASAEKKALSKQLKGYLLFFEQVLAGYLAQLEQLAQLFSPDLSAAGPYTYFNQPLYQVPGIEQLLQAFSGHTAQDWEAFAGDNANTYRQVLQQTETDATYRDRKNRVLDHLLSRFNLRPDNYPVTLYERCYRRNRAAGRINDELLWKAALLRNTQLLNNHRVRAFHYLRSADYHETAPGFHASMRLLLYINSKEHFFLSKVVSDFAADVAATGGGDRYLPERVETDQETLEILVNADDPVQMNAPLRLARLPLSFFAWGTDLSNYKLLESLFGHLLLYREPGQQQWKIAALRASKTAALRALRLMIQQLRNLSIRSEGFHVVEHVLLAPPKESRVFGFRFYDENGELLLEQHEWLSYTAREQQLAAILQAANDPAGEEGLLHRLHGHCSIVFPGDEAYQAAMRKGDHAAIPAEVKQSFAARLLVSLRLWKRQQTAFYPKFDFVLSHWDHTVISEDLFNSRLTVVLPAWPQRFQDKGFRSFAEHAFTSHLPAHIRTRFLWLGIAKMRQFEEMFSYWRGALLNKDDHLLRPSYAALVVSFLLAETKPAYHA